MFQKYFYLQSQQTLMSTKRTTLNAKEMTEIYKKNKHK